VAALLLPLRRHTLELASRASRDVKLRNPASNAAKTPSASVNRIQLTDPSLSPSQQATSLRSIKSLVPLLDRVLVQRVKAEAKTASGIFLPESTVKELNEAKVLAVGPGALDKDGKRVPMGVSAGDRVLIPQVCLPRRWHLLFRFGLWHEVVLTGLCNSTVARLSRLARRSTTSSGTASK
jgi:chaperonin GroES